MGDRTTVSITVRKTDYERLLAKEGDSETTFLHAIGADSIDDDGDWKTTWCHEVNYADWDDLQDILKENLIPYDKTWDAGDDYSAGESYVRFVNAEMRELEFHEDERKLVEFLRDVKDLPADAIKAKVQEEYERQFPWDIEKL